MDALGVAVFGGVVGQGVLSVWDTVSGCAARIFFLERCAERDGVAYSGRV